MELRILGPLEAHRDGRPLELGGLKQRALLALLLLEANRVVPRDGLIDALWEEDPPATAHKALQVYVSRLRALLGAERLETRAPGYALRVEPEEVDLARFRQLRDEGRPGDALALWRGPPLAEFAGYRFAQPEIARLEELRIGCLEERAERELAAGRHAELAPELEALVKQYPLRERLRGQLMLCLYRCGRQAAALEAYREARSALVDELGIEPGHALRDLHQAILEQDPALELVPATAPAGRRRGGVFVGRGRELAELAGGLDDAFAGHGRLCLLVGEPGIGKSQLAEELMAVAEARGARVLAGRCWEAGGAPAYWPWVQSLRAYVRACDAEELRAQLGSHAGDLAQLLPELRERLPDIGEPAAAEPDEARFRLFDATAQFLRRAAAERPLVLALDDLHAADAPSLLLLRFIARELGSMRVLVLGACRNVDPLPGPALADMLAEVGREPVTRRLELSGLSAVEMADYVARAAGEIGSPGLAAELHEQTEGNPLFAGEFVRLLSVEGRRAIPESVREVIAQRLTHLSEDCNGVLLWASVIGREFALDALGRVSDVTEGDLLDVLDEAIAARVVSSVPGAPGHARFAHVLIRDTLYDGLSGARRAHLHREVADALEALYGDEPGPHLAQLAHHALAGRDVERGVRYATLAGDRALALLAHEEAARQYATGLEALGSADEQRRCELLLALGEAHSRAGDAAAAKRAFRDAASLARRLGLAHQLARAAAAYGGRILFSRAADDEWLLPLLEEALAAVGEDDVELRIRLLARLAGALRDEPARDRRDAVSREAVELARRSGDPAALAYALDGRGFAILAPGTVAETLALSTELREVAERVGDTERMLHGYMHGLGPLILLARISEAESGLAAAERLAEQLGQPVHRWDVWGAKAMLALALGRLDDGARLVAEAAAIGERAQPEVAMAVHRVQRYTLADFRGGLEALEPEIRELAAERPARPVFRCVLVHLLARTGQRAEATRELRELTAAGCAALPVDQEWLFAMSCLAETAGLLEDAEVAGGLYELLAPWADLNVVDQCEGIRGAVARYLGLLAAATGRRPEAGHHFEAALEMNARMGARPWLARTQEDYARLVQTDDRAHAGALSEAAAASYGELGMAPAGPLPAVR